MGTTGSRKPSFLKLLGQLQTQQGGRIRKGEQAINDVSLYGWRDWIPYVTQETVLFFRVQFISVIFCLFYSSCCLHVILLTGCSLRSMTHWMQSFTAFIRCS